MRYPLLDPLRGIAAVWVFAHHLVCSFDAEAAPGLLRLGYFGVPMFFVISGYCLTAAGRRPGAVREPERFLYRRARRVFPPFWAAVGATVAVYAALPALGPPLSAFEGYAARAWHELRAPDWLRVLTLTAGFGPGAEMPWDKYAPVNLAFWTLAIEVQFYAVVWVAVRAGARFYHLLGAVTVLSVPFLFSGTAFVSGWFLPFWPFFALGAGVCAVVEAGRLPRGPTGRVALAGLGAALMAGGLAAAPLAPDGGRAMVLGEFAFAVGFAAALAAAWRPGAPPARGPLGYLGTVSYSLYLLHVPLMMPVGHALGAALQPGGPAFVLATICAVCALVYPFYRLVERPCLSDAPRTERGPVLSA